MENNNDTNNGNSQKAFSNSVEVIKDNTKAQHESNYDSHSEEMPHQTTVVNTDSNPDRVSNDNRDTTIINNAEANESEDEGSEVDDIENDVSHSNLPSFPNKS